MILFLNEERAYLNWVTHHRQGYVLDCTRKPTTRHLTLHRATCSQVKKAEARRTHWTTGSHMKGCSLDLDELRRWAVEQAGGQPAICAACRPGQEPANSSALGEPHLTRLDRDILSCVLEIASYHIEAEDHAYVLSVGMIARCLAKSEGQLAAALHRLVDEGLLTISAQAKPGGAFPSRAKIFPTASALRTLDAYAQCDDARLAVELEKLG